MILTSLDTLIVDDYPQAIENALSFICANKTALYNAVPGQYHQDSLIFDIHEGNHQNFWHAHKNSAVIHFIIAGEEFIEIAHISSLIQVDSDNECNYYTGSKKGRVKLNQGDIVILYPEFAYMTQASYHQQTFKKCVMLVPIS